MNAIIHSVNADAGAKRLIEKLEKGTLKLDILPNSYEQYDGELEQKDFISFCEFIKSRNGRIVLKMLDENFLQLVN